MGEPNSEKDVAVLQIQMQVLERDLLKDRDLTSELEDRVRRIEDKVVWIMGAAFVVGSIFALVGLPLLKILAKALA